jgi:sugar porter (SP) family MFS transporter
MNDGDGNPELLPEKGSIIYVYILSCIAAVGGLLFGFDFGVISGAIPFVTKQFQLDAYQQGFATSSAIIGCIFGALFAGILCDKYGRKKILMGTALLFAISAVLSSIPQTLTQLVIARFIGGLAVGVASMVSPMYIAEISPARIRGRLVSVNQFAIILGINLAYICNALLVKVGAEGYQGTIMTFLDNAFRDLGGYSGHTNWRWMFGVETVPSIALFIGLFFVPESPRWLTKQGKSDWAMKVLARIGGRDHARQEMEDIQLTLAMESEKGSVFELLKPGFRLVLLIGVSLAVIQQISGANTVLIYASDIFMKAGFTDEASALWSLVLIGITSLTFTVLAMAIVDKIGRKPLLLIGSAGMAISLVIMTLSFQVEIIPQKWIVVPAIVYIAIYSFTLAPVVWVVLSEIFPTDIRGRAMSIATFSLWVACFAVLQTFPVLLEYFGENTFYGYAAICAFAFFFVLFIVKETKGKTLEEIERSWKR